MKIPANTFRLPRWLTKPQWVFSLISPLVALAIWLTSYAVPANASLIDAILGGVQVVQLSSISDQQEIALGSQMNQQILHSEFHLLNDPVVAKYVDQVGQNLVPYSERPNIPYHFQVLQDKQVNAFATMGGYVYVTSGLLATADNEAQVASVVGHEMGHIASKHVLKQMKQQALESGIAGAAGVSRNAAANLGIKLALDLPGSRKHEFQADKLGLFSFTKKGYDPVAMPTFMQKLVKSGSTPAFLSTHPATPERIRLLNQMIADNHLTTGSLGLGHTDYQATIKSRLHS